MLPLKKFLPAIAWFIFVLVLICLPGDDLPEADSWMSAVYFDKWVHIGLFSVLAFLFMFPFCKSALPVNKKWHAVIKTAVAVSLWGITTEFIQRYFIPGRSFDLGDWAADSFGALLAVFVCWKFFLSKKRNH